MTLMDSNLKAKLVYDGGAVRIPEEMGAPRFDQLQGTEVEQLFELAGRGCYDSLGQGRSSADYHQHILDVRHLSVYEHACFTLVINAPLQELLLIIPYGMNRPGVYMHLEQPKMGPQNPNMVTGLRIRLNPRACVEWNRPRFQSCGLKFGDVGERLALTVAAACSTVCPQLIPGNDHFKADKLTTIHGWQVIVETAPYYAHERWVSLYMSMSRGCSHELVRHGDETAISQRSTRYVDEIESPWVKHPLVAAYEALDDGVGLGLYTDCDGAQDDLRTAAQTAYADATGTLQTWLTDRGVDKTTARKQARGAARGYLGNALTTTMIFSASVPQWQCMLDQRASQFADAEIRLLFAGEDDDSLCVINALRQSQFANSFKHYVAQPSPDDIGRVLVKE